MPSVLSCSRICAYVRLCGTQSGVARRFGDSPTCNVSLLWLAFALITKPTISNFGRRRRIL